ncbi:AraC family transcriptional regulator [Roseinatronobacter alkalisoli]|uniref:AraC family transcriptional regulator n=1 Tax=Roseinatronobacter alkalisoli TaxID=3028235 RepID=A0ABT5T6S2_9RHOB|nr:AraC family transcriptional regulator [Roseinatronobacter sp. HJB301]MDD7970807.1 AraC family transcriptional regulator [Roseinatronobacter sp. HJB301]
MESGQFQVFRCTMPGVMAVSADTPHRFNRHVHDQFGIGVIQRGAQKSMSGRGLVEAQAGDVITVNPGEVHDGSPVDGSGRSWRMLFFDPEPIARLMAVVTQEKCPPDELAHPTLRDPISAARFLALFRAMTDPSGGHSEIESRQALILLLARLIDRPVQATPASAPEAIAQARARIDDDPATLVTLSELASLSGLSEFQLLRGFAKETGLTPHAYLIQRRLQQARRRIAAGAALADAAVESGFADQSHMTRLFVRTYGMTPGRFAAAMC